MRCFRRCGCVCEFPVNRAPKFLERLQSGHYAAQRQWRLPSEWSTEPDAAHYRALQRKARDFRLGLHEHAWFDLWHTHFDWDTFSNRNAIHLRRHLRIGFRMFRQATEQLRAWGKPHQVFLNLSASDGGASALYVHTPNPNGTAFPHAFATGVLVQHPPPWLTGFVSADRHVVYREVWNGETWFVVTNRSEND